MLFSGCFALSFGMITKTPHLQQSSLVSGLLYGYGPQLPEKVGEVNMPKRHKHDVATVGCFGSGDAKSRAALLCHAMLAISIMQKGARLARVISLLAQSRQSPPIRQELRPEPICFELLFILLQFASQLSHLGPEGLSRGLPLPALHTGCGRPLPSFRKP